MKYPIVIKRIFLFSVILFLVSSSCKTNSTISPSMTVTNTTPTADVYFFPVQPGSVEWRAFKSQDEIIAACQVPEGILKNMTTRGLVLTVMYYPLWIGISLYDNPQSGFQSIAKRANCVQELYTRDDAATELLAYYHDIQVIEKTSSSAQKANYATTLTIIETLLSQQPIQDKMTPEEHDRFNGEDSNKH